MQSPWPQPSSRTREPGLISQYETRSMRCSIWERRLGELFVGVDGERASRKYWANSAALDSPAGGFEVESAIDGNLKLKTTWCARFGVY